MCILPGAHAHPLVPAAQLAHHMKGRSSSSVLRTAKLLNQISFFCQTNAFCSRAYLQRMSARVDTVPKKFSLANVRSAFGFQMQSNTDEHLSSNKFPFRLKTSTSRGEEKCDDDDDDDEDHRPLTLIFAADCTVGVKGSDPALESEQTTRRPLALPIRPRLKNPSAPTTTLECLTGSKERKGLLTSACDELLVAIISTEQRERHNKEHPLAKPPPISNYQYSCHFQDLQLQQKQSHDEHSVLLLLRSCS